MSEISLLGINCCILQESIFMVIESLFSFAFVIYNIICKIFWLLFTMSWYLHILENYTCYCEVNEFIITMIGRKITEGDTEWGGGKLSWNAYDFKYVSWKCEIYLFHKNFKKCKRKAINEKKEKKNVTQWQLMEMYMLITQYVSFYLPNKCLNQSIILYLIIWCQ